MMFLVVAAIIPIIGLCFFVYHKDKNREPLGLLIGIFLLGFIAVFPILVCELVFGAFFPMNTNSGFIPIFFNVLFGVAIYEEGFKWLITKFLGYNNKQFDEVYDIIVYSVFSSLGFACFENILYVLQNGLGNAVMRALLAVPGHTCFAISMGYFLSKAKVNQINGNRSLYSRNMVLSIIVPILLHTIYDALLFNFGEVSTVGSLLIKVLPFIIFYSAMVISCFITVDKTAKIQENLSLNIRNGVIGRDDKGFLYYNNVNPTAPIMGVSNAAVPITNVPVAQNGMSVPSRSTPGLGATYYDQPVISQEVPSMSNVPQASAVGTVEILESTMEMQQVSAQPVPVTSPAIVSTTTTQPELTACPICGHPTKGKNFCSRCGFRLK